MSDTFTTRFDGPAPEQEVAGDMAKRAVFAAPVLLLFGLLWGVDGVLSVAYGIGIVVVNFLLAAAMIAYAARVSLGLMMGAALGGFFVRMGLVAVAIVLVVDQPWVELVPLCITLIVTHLGLLFWETRHVSASLAFPGLKPKPVKVGSTEE